MIDWSRVSELREEVGEEDFAEVVDLFLEEVDEVLERLRRADESESIAADLHFLKGSALNLGFQNLSAVCVEQERMLALDPSRVPDLTGLVSVYETSKSTFLVEQTNQPAA